MAKTRKRTRSKHRRSYGVIPVRQNFLPALAALPLVPILLWSGGIFAAWKTYTTASAIGRTLSRPTVLIGGGVGLIYGYKAEGGMFQKLAYMAAGVGAGMLLDKLFFPEEQES